MKQLPRERRKSAEVAPVWAEAAAGANQTALLRDALDGLLELYSAPSEAAFPQKALQMLRRLIPSLFGSYYEVEAGRTPLRHVYDPKQYGSVSSRLLPLAAAFAGEAQKDESLDQRVRESLNKPTGQRENSTAEPQLDDAVVLKIQPSLRTTIIFVLTRAGAMFGDDERKLATLLQPHLLCAYGVACARAAHGPSPGGEDDPAATPGLLQRRFRLTRRQSDLLYWLVRGKSNREMGIIFGISARTVDKHLQHVFDKLDVASRHAAVVKAMEALGSA